MGGRVHEDKLVALARVREDGCTEVCAPAVGLYREAPPRGAIVGATMPIGVIECLGKLVRVDTGPDVRGLVVAHGEVPQLTSLGCFLGEGGELARRPVGYGDLLFVLDPRGVESAAAETARASEGDAARGLVFRSPSSGRYYARPAPGEAPFVAVGDVVTVGQTLAILEVMKTFNRVVYGGEGLPERACVKRIVPESEADVDAGDILLELEPA